MIMVEIGDILDWSQVGLVIAWRLAFGIRFLWVLCCYAFFSAFIVVDMVDILRLAVVNYEEVPEPSLMLIKRTPSSSPSVVCNYD